MDQHQNFAATPGNRKDRLVQKFRAFLLVLGLHMLMCLKQAYDGENGFQKHGCQVLYNQLVIRVNSEKTSSRFTPPQVPFKGDIGPLRGS